VCSTFLASESLPIVVAATKANKWAEIGSPPGKAKGKASNRWRVFQAARQTFNRHRECPEGPRGKSRHAKKECTGNKFFRISRGHIIAKHPANAR